MEVKTFVALLEGLQDWQVKGKFLEFRTRYLERLVPVGGQRWRLCCSSRRLYWLLLSLLSPTKCLAEVAGARLWRRNLLWLTAVSYRTSWWEARCP